MTSTEHKDRPPRLVRLLLRMLVGRSDLEELDELFACRVERFGIREARRAYRVELWWGIRGGFMGQKQKRESGETPGRRHQSTDESTVVGLLSGIMADIRFASRRLKKSPGFTVAAVVVLALAIGATVTAYGAFRMAVLTPPPFPDSERLVSVELKRTRNGEERVTRWPYPQYRLLEDWAGRLVDPIASYKGITATLTNVGPATLTSIEIVSPGFFDLLGRSPVLGRGFAPEEADIHGDFQVAVISFDFWRSRMGGDPAVLGHQFRLNGEVFRVVGVAPQGFNGLGWEVELWVPFGATEMFLPGRLEQAYNHMVKVVGRLAPPASLTAARTQIGAVSDALAEAFPGVTYSTGLSSFAEVWENPGAQTSVRLFSAAAGMLLLVACANLSGLLLARSHRVVRDGAVRMALGASRVRLFWATLVESLLIATLGGLAGIVFSKWATSVVTHIWPTEFSSNEEAGLLVVDPGTLTLDSGLLAYALIAVLATAVLTGLVPALRASSTEPAIHLKTGSDRSRRKHTLLGLDAHSALVGIQVSLAVILLIGAGLMGTSVKKLLGVEDGFPTENLLTFDYTLPLGYEEVDIVSSNLDEWVTRTSNATSFDARLTERLLTLPGVEAATTGCKLLQSYICAHTAVSAIDGRPDYEPNSEIIGVVSVGDDYFDILDIPLRQGRTFNPNDGLSGEPVVVLSELAAATFFPDGNSIGRRIGPGFSAPGRQMARVVGIVANIRHMRADEDPVPIAYFSNRERRFTSHAIVRTTGDPSAIMRPVREAVAALDPTVALSSIETAEQIVGRGIANRTLILRLLTAFAATTVLLASVGTWGVVANAVANRRRELGIRLALGARHDRVVHLVVRQSLIATTLGMMAGMIAAWFGTGLLETFLWQVDARDPTTFLAGGVFLLIVAAVASYLPARHATKIDPVQTLNAE